MPVFYRHERGRAGLEPGAANALAAFVCCGAMRQIRISYCILRVFVCIYIIYIYILLELCLINIHL